MKRFAALFLVVLLASPLVWAEEDAAEADEADDYGGEERAHLIVRKYTKEDLSVQGRNLTIYVDVYNAGTNTAKKVTVKDAALPAGVKLLQGELSASFAKVDVGDTASHSYVIMADGATQHALDPATVTYVAEVDSTDVQTGTSNKCYFYVMTAGEQIQRHLLNAGRYASLGMARTPTDWRNIAIAVAVVGLLLGGNSAVKGMASVRSNARREKALKSLERDE